LLDKPNLSQPRRENNQYKTYNKYHTWLLGTIHLMPLSIRWMRPNCTND
jgi:hypothetical protein